MQTVDEGCFSTVAVVVFQLYCVPVSVTVPDMNIADPSACVCFSHRTHNIQHYPSFTIFFCVQIDVLISQV